MMNEFDYLDTDIEELINNLVDVMYSYVLRNTDKSGNEIRHVVMNVLVNFTADTIFSLVNALKKMDSVDRLVELFNKKLINSCEIREKQRDDFKSFIK